MSADRCSSEPAHQIGIRERLNEQLDAYVTLATSPGGVVTVLTLGITLSSPPRGAWLVTPLLALVGLFFLPAVHRNWRYWAILTAVTASGVLTHPILDLDNHHFLHLYWLLAMTLACTGHDPQLLLARSGRLLIGWLFTFATLWKLMTSDFVDGSFLTYVLSTDLNATRLPNMLGLVDQATVTDNVASAAAMAELVLDPTATSSTAVLEVPEVVMLLGRPLSLATLALEAAVALTFLLPLRGRWTRWREASLFAFLLVTYPALPVLSFAALLLAMSLAASTLRSPIAQVSHLGMFLIAAAVPAVLQALPA